MNYSMKTTNKSFINMWRYLQRYYVENNLFMLQTNSPDLVDFSIEKYMSFDRDDPSFPVYRSKVIQEAKENIWFYFRELAVMPDETSITGYKQFELTPESMMMIYLYEKNKSFINTTTDNEFCLHYLWNRTTSIYNNDLVMVNDIDTAMDISKQIKKVVANMPIQVPFGSTQVMSDDVNHFIVCDLKSFQDFYLHQKYKSFDLYVFDKSEKYLTDNPWVNKLVPIFILEDNLSLLAYSHILELNHGEVFYFNTIGNNNSTDKIILDKFLKMMYPKADTSIYDTSEINLKSLYII